MSSATEWWTIVSHDEVKKKSAWRAAVVASGRKNRNLKWSGLLFLKKGKGMAGDREGGIMAETSEGIGLPGKRLIEGGSASFKSAKLETARDWGPIRDFSVFNRVRTVSRRLEGRWEISYALCLNERRRCLHRAGDQLPSLRPCQCVEIRQKKNVRSQTAWAGARLKKRVYTSVNSIVGGETSGQRQHQTGEIIDPSLMKKVLVGEVRRSVKRKRIVGSPAKLAGGLVSTPPVGKGSWAIVLPISRKNKKEKKGISRENGMKRENLNLHWGVGVGWEKGTHPTKPQATLPKRGGGEEKSEKTPIPKI